MTRFLKRELNRVDTGGMRAYVRQNAVPIAAAVVALLTVGWLSLIDWLWNDYDNEVRPAFDALVNGHVLQFLQLAPTYGGSLIMRAPFVLVPRLWGGGELSMFRAASAPCMAASAILGVWLVSYMRERGTSTLARAVTLFLIVANPITLAALEFGHPEELLGVVLCVAAVLVAMRGRAVWAGVLLGLAIANKEWALLAVGPVLLALPDRRLRAVLSCGVTAGVILAPLVLAGHLVSRATAATQTGSIFRPTQFWWLLGSHQHVLHLGGGHTLVLRDAPSWIAADAHWLIVVVAFALSLAVAARRRRSARRALQEPLLLLALALLIRCALDPWDISYYTLPFLIALTVWEAAALRRPPVLALFASFAAWFLFQWGPDHFLPSETRFLLFTALALPAMAAMLLALFAPGLASRLSPGLAEREPVPTPA